MVRNITVNSHMFMAVRSITGMCFCVLPLPSLPRQAGFSVAVLCQNVSSTLILQVLAESLTFQNIRMAVPVNPFIVGKQPPVKYGVKVTLLGNRMGWSHVFQIEKDHLISCTPIGLIHQENYTLLNFT